MQCVCAAICTLLLFSGSCQKLAVASMAYTPDGIRGFGPFLAHSRWQTDLMGYRNAKQNDLVCCLTIETRDAVENIHAICQVPGIDVIVPAPFDLTSMGAALTSMLEGQEFRSEALLATAAAAVTKAGAAAGQGVWGEQEDVHVDQLLRSAARNLRTVE